MLFQSIHRTIATVMISVAIALMVMALVSYIITFIGVIRKSDGFDETV
jgi:hypothetical protein